MHNPLKFTWHFLQNKPYPKPPKNVINLKTEIIQSSFSSHNEIKLEIKTRKTENTETF